MRFIQRRNIRTILLSVAMLFLVVACGSTVQDRSSLAQRGGGAPVDEFGNPIPGATAAPNATGSFVPGAPGSTIGGPGGTGGVTRGGPGSVAAGRNGPGITATKIFIGISYCDDDAAIEQILGANQAASDERRAWEIVIEDTNKRGGIGGRQVEPVWKQLQCTSNQSFSSMYEDACQHFTRDHKVFAVMGAQADVPNYIACVLRAGAVVIDTNVTDSDKFFFRQHPYMILPSAIAIDSVARLQVQALKAQNYFARIDPTFPAVRIGIVVYATAGEKRTLTGALLPALREAGYSVSNDHIAQIQPIQRLSDLGAFSAAISSAVLRFSTDGVSHVLFLQPSGTVTLVFLREAENQRYFPRYGLNSQDAGQYVLDIGAVSARNFRNALGIGWEPMIDVPRESRPAAPPERIACEKLLTSKGYRSFGDSNAEAIALNVCDGMSFLKLAVGRAGSVVNQATFLAAVNGIGNNRWRGTGELGYSLLTPSKHDGTNHYRYLRFDEACPCFSYTSPNFTVGF